MKQLVILVLLVQLLPSCITYRNLTKNEPITYDLLSKLEPGKKYKFELKVKNSLPQIIYVTGVDSETITGYFYQKSVNGKRAKINYSETFEKIQLSTSKISVAKHNPLLTTTAILVPAVVIVSIYLASYSPFD